MNSGEELQFWRAPECAVEVAYPAATLDAVRLAVLEAFYAFPRGGAEVGGVLYGTHQHGRVTISAWRDLGCEHATGPSFTLSGNDHERMAALLRAPESDSELAGMAPVGWYHSHNRSEIFLSPQDVEIHERYFPDAWQVALVLRPSIMGTRAGFFARDPAGELRAEASYLEFPLEPLSGRALRAQVAGASTPEANGQPAAPVVEEQVTASEQKVPLLEPPAFLRVAPPTPRSRKLWPWALLVQVIISTGAIYATRGYWGSLLPPPTPPQVRVEPVDLQAFDQGGQLHIRWNPRAPVVVAARSGTLDIRDGEARTMIVIEPERLRLGGVTYVRQTDHVELRLNLMQTLGRPAVAQTTFVGKPAPAPPPADDTAHELRRQRDSLKKQLEEARTQLLNQGLLIRKLQSAIRESKSGTRTAP